MTVVDGSSRALRESSHRQLGNDTASAAGAVLLVEVQYNDGDMSELQDQQDGMLLESTYG